MKIHKLSLLALSATLLVACGSKAVKTDPQPEPAAPAKSLTEIRTELSARATARWRHLIERKAELAYDFLTPGYRETRTREDYAQAMNNRPVKWQDVAFIDASCDEPEVCVVRLNITYELEMPVRMTGKVSSIDVLDEKWIFADGEWFMLPDVKRDLR
jgi:hypothetical protein